MWSAPTRPDFSRPNQSQNDHSGRQTTRSGNTDWLCLNLQVANSVARLKISKTTRNFPKTTSLATRQEIPKNDQFTDQDFQITKKRPGNFDLRPGFYSKWKNLKIFFINFAWKMPFYPYFLTILTKVEKRPGLHAWSAPTRPDFCRPGDPKNAQVCRKRPGLATLRTRSLPI